MALDPAHLPDGIATLKAMLLSRDAEIEDLRLTIAKMQRDRFGAKSERGSKLLDQFELQLAELEEGVAQDRVAGELVMPPGDTETERQKPARRPLPAHLPRERVVHQGPHDCPSCGGRRAAAIYRLIETCKLNGVNVYAWLADVLARINDHPMQRLDELLPWNWQTA